MSMVKCYIVRVVSDNDRVDYYGTFDDHKKAEDYADMCLGEDGIVDASVEIVWTR